MKALITVIDDNGKVICKDKVLDPFKEEIVDLNHGLPIKETRFSFILYSDIIIKEKTEQWTKEAEEAGMSLTEYLKSINPLNHKEEA